MQEPEPFSQKQDLEKRAWKMTLEQNIGALVNDNT